MPQREEVPRVALVLAIDASGSMNSDRKIALAREAAMSAVEVLGESDQVAVVVFSGGSHVLLPLQPARDRTRVAAALARITAAGGTGIAPALRDAYRILSHSRARIKHVILLSDGRFAPADFESLTAALAADAITVSTVAIGAGADVDLLRNIARWGGGRAYFTEDPFNIPRIFTRETLRAAHRGVVEEPFRPRPLRPSPLTSGLDWEEAPMLLGYSMTLPRPDAETILAAPPEVGGLPLLARWRYGLGTVVAFTSDARNRWAAEWLASPLYARFWTRVARATMRSRSAETGPDGTRLRIAVTLRGGTAHLRADALDLADEFVDSLAVSARVAGPAGTAPLTVPLAQTGPGRYEARFEVSRPGTYAVQTFVEGSGGPSAGAGTAWPGPACAFVRPDSGDAPPLVPDVELMRLVAEAGGGRLLSISAPDGLEDLFRPAGGGRPMQERELWPVLLWTVLAVLLADVFLKRVRMPAALRRVREDEERRA